MEHSQDVNQLQTTYATEYHVPFNLEGSPALPLDVFVGRTAELENIRDALLPNAIGRRRRKEFVVGGEKGIGKTQLAIQFARQYHTSFSAVFWVNAESAALAEQSIVRIARRIPQVRSATQLHEDGTDTALDVKKIVDQLLDWFSKPSNDRWLLIFDGVDTTNQKIGDKKTAFGISNIIPRSYTGSVLVTCRLTTIPRLAASLLLGPMSKVDAEAIFNQRYGPGVPARDLLYADQLLQLLNFNPMAVTLASTCMKAAQLTVLEYIQVHVQEGMVATPIFLSLIRAEEGDVNDSLEEVQYSLLTAWITSYRLVLKCNPSSILLLELWSRVSYCELSYELISTGIRVANQNEIPAWILQLARDKSMFDDAMEVLCAYSLVEKTLETDTYRLHPVFHHWSNFLMADEKRRDLDFISCHLVAEMAMDDDDDNANWDHDRRLLPHVLKLHDRVQHPPESEFDGQLLISSYYKLARILHRQDMLTEAVNFCLWARDLSEIELGADHLWTLSIISRLGLLYSEQGKGIEAEKMYQSALDRCEKSLGLRHTLTEHLIHNLAVLYSSQERYDEAEITYMRGLYDLELHLGTDNLSTIRHLNALASLYTRNNKVLMAEDLYQRALKILQTNPEEEHPYMRGILHSLGQLYRRMAFEAAFPIQINWPGYNGGGKKRPQEILRDCLITSQYVSLGSLLYPDLVSMLIRFKYDDVATVFFKHVLSSGQDVWEVRCDGCDAALRMFRTCFVCKSCWDCTLCGTCYLRYQLDDIRIEHCQDHKFLHIDQNDHQSLTRDAISQLGQKFQARLESLPIPSSSNRVLTMRTRHLARKLHVKPFLSTFSLSEYISWFRQGQISAGRPLLPYRPLEPDEIRLLQIYPGEETDDIRLDFIYASLNDSPVYDALSYTWGSWDPPRYLKCGETTMRVTKNLHDALCRFRKLDAPRTIWADAISINQRDKVEKSRQIPKMLEIYSKAASRLIWLGHPPQIDTADLAFDAILSLERIISNLVDTSRLAIRNKPGIDNHDPDRPPILNEQERKDARRDFTLKVLNLQMSEEQYRALASLFGVEWFNRVWVVQEAAAERQRVKSSTLAVWGRREVDLDSLITVAGAFDEFEAPFLTDALPMNILRAIGQERREGAPVVLTLQTSLHGNARNNWDLFLGGTRSRLFAFLRTSQSLSSSDPRDKLFAFLGLMDAEVGSEAFLQPDYSKSVVEVYIDIARFFITRELCLDILELVCDQPPDQNKIVGLPSWVPDWTQKPRAAPFYLKYDRFGAGGLTWHGQSHAASQATFCANDRRLWISCYHVGMIERHVPPTIECTLEYIRSRHPNIGNSSIDKYRAPWEADNAFVISILIEALRYKDCVARASTLDPAFDGSLEDCVPPSKEAIYLATGESLYDAFWRTLVCDLDAYGGKAVPEMANFFQDYHRYIDTFLHRPAERDYGNRGVWQFQKEFLRYTQERRFCTTDTKLMGWVPRTARIGDTICVIPGARMPYIIRLSDDKTGCKLIGPAYIHGVMEAENNPQHSSYKLPKGRALFGDRLYSLCLA